MALGQVALPLMATGPDLTLGEEVGRILLVAVLAGAVGVERELRDQEAGLRTHMLVGVGAALFVIAGNYAWSDLDFGNATGIVLDPSRVVAYVVTGVGFLGAGTIIKNGASIRGLTTAASLWVVAAIGVVGGAGQYSLALFATAVVLVSLWPVKGIARYLGLRRTGTRRLVVLLDAESKLGDALLAVEETGVEVQATTVADEPGGRRLELILAGRNAELLAALDRLSRAPGVRTAALDP
jgi:putative Mg2+ transporter-C (MgtC) family protein